MDKKFLEKLASYGSKKGIGPMPGMDEPMSPEVEAPQGPSMAEHIQMAKASPDFDALVAIKMLLEESESMEDSMEESM